VTLPILIVALSYLLGSIPFGFLIVHAMEGADVRATGSGGTGATNVSRRAGKKAGAITLFLDAAKGAVAVLLAQFLLTPDFGINWWVAAASIAVVAGHVFPVWLKFRGGKGVATGLGVFLCLSPIAVASAALLFLFVVLITRYVSLGSIIAATSLPLNVWYWSARYSEINSAPLITTAIVGSALIIFTHRANIIRLVQGKESKFK
jgi:acyl phosphate:glycerol-3-phosphate acyltransferase